MGKATKLTQMTTDEMRTILSDEVRRIRTDETTPAAANAVSNAVGKILSSVRLEMEYARLVGRKPFIEMLAGKVDRDDG